MTIAFEEKSQHVVRDGGHGGAAGGCSSDVAVGRRRMALATSTLENLIFFHFLASAISSGPKYSWIRVIVGQQCCCFNFGSFWGRLDEEMTLDVSDGPALARFDGWHRVRLSLCLKRPSFYCLIHFYQRDCYDIIHHASLIMNHASCNLHLFQNITS